jgi:uncharacterized protein YndB with AHSA1/START domain
MKYVLIVLGIIAALILIVVLVGWSLPVKHHVTREAAVRAPAATVFATITDVDKFPEWRKSVQRVEHVADSSGRKRFREIGGNGTILFEIETEKPGEQLVTRIADPSLPFGGTWTYDLIRRGDTTTVRITEDGEVYNPVFRFVSRFVMGHAATIDRYLADLTARCDVKQAFR